MTIDAAGKLSQGMDIAPIIEQHLDEIRAVCRVFGVARFEVFGSVQTRQFDETRSDIDFLIEYPDGYGFGPWLGRLFDLEATLAKICGRPVDLVMTSALRNKWFRQEAAKTRTEILMTMIAQVACMAIIRGFDVT